MAIVFVSPRKKQKVFFTLIVLGVVLLLAIIAFLILLPEFLHKNLEVTPGISSGPNIIINLAILDSEKVKSLEPFTTLGAQFSYVVKDQEGKEITGIISAPTREEAQKLLEAAGFQVISLQGADAGRQEPFISY